MYTTSTAFLDTLQAHGVTCLFSNFGSDHPALIEAIAEARSAGRSFPRIITCPNEMVALSCAQGFAQATGEAQAVLVHVECGTQALAGAVHNAARSRTPVLIFAGMSPYTQHGERKGSRNEFIHWLQDVQDQPGIVRGYMKYSNEIRSGANAAQIVSRALQIATSDPKGPVYLTGTREAMEEEATPADLAMDHWRPLSPRALAGRDVDEIAEALDVAKRPVVVTSYLGRNPAAVDALAAFCAATGAGVLEASPAAMNFPHADPHYLGNYWNDPKQNEALAQADLVLVIDSDVPWIPMVNQPAADATIFHIDVDPLKQAMTLWHIAAKASFEADAETALNQLLAKLGEPDATNANERTRRWAALHEARRSRLDEDAADAGKLTTAMVTAALRRHAGEDALILSEGITNYGIIADHVAPALPGTFFASGGSSLGWHGGAAIGMKLAHPGRDVVAITGDGSFMFSVPSTVHWMARKYATPFLTVVLNNGGWNAPRFSALAVHPDGYASRANDLDLSFDPAPDYGLIAAASGGSFHRKVTRPDELETALGQAFHAIRQEGRAAVLDICL
ncbi:thiamine pyrophosphate-requiring protein [Rhizobium halophytocola]|uniref:Acetolactate synthase-1/2/3 large subunit n=1 Tax=Rhizobium halophytocola TaxID=735519 RepID=A0ABS4E2E1_9HYPH|nr:thiamine pyrophosphate-requiring protein [Rhizobium halophytocola]MBP1852088.1 acetolactate synthase-1/2/3 large subunit [Rhizobium halophytocola]